MKRCLCPGNSPYLGRRSFYSLRRSSVSCRRQLQSPLRKGPPITSRQPWSRPVTTSAGVFTSAYGTNIVRRHTGPSSLKKFVRARHPGCPVRTKELQKDPSSWIPHLEKYLAVALRTPTNDETLYRNTRGLCFLLSDARAYGACDPLAHLGFGLKRWSDVYILLNHYLDATDVLRGLIPQPPISPFDWGAAAGISIRQLALGRGGSASPVQVRQDTPGSPSRQETTLDLLTYRPYAEDFCRLVMAEVWQTLGSIILEAADRTPDESKLGMTYVYRILARLHHSGAIPDNIYRYAPPAAYQTVYRPPGMYLLSTNIMSVLTEMAWRAHDEESVAKAAAAGEEYPYIPFKMGVRELGPEIWLELVLWCCVEHGYPKEGLWLLERMKARSGDLAWGFQSWKPLLEDQGRTVNQTKVDSEEFWRRPDEDIPVQETGKSASFHGLAKRTISMELVTSLRDSLSNYVYLGLGHRGLSPSKFARYVTRFEAVMGTPKRQEGLLPTTKETTWFTVRSLESAGLDLNADPIAFDHILRASPQVEAPWDDRAPLLERDLKQLTKSQIYDSTSAFLGLIEYNIRTYCIQRQTGLAFKSFAWLQEVIDSSKARHINQFFERVTRTDPDNFPLVDADGDLMGYKALESSTPQVSNATYAELLDLSTACRALPFADHLLFSLDIDGPPIRVSEYGNQTLAPSIVRFAAVTRNQKLYRRVFSSLMQPFSLNTLRALINYAILMGDWDRVVPMLEFVRENRLKSWGHSNVMALAGSILRMENGLRRPTRNISRNEKQKALDKAKEILLRILNGEFNDLSERTANNRFQRRAIRNIHRVLLSIPGSLSEIASKAKLDPFYFLVHRNTKITSNNIPYIPSAAFHNLLSAVVDTQGCAAGKRLYEQWCLEPRSPAFKRVHEGGIKRLFTASERDARKGDPHFDVDWFKQIYQKAAVPNLNTVRIIAQGAIRDYTQYQQRRAKERLVNMDGAADAAPVPAPVDAGVVIDADRGADTSVTADLDADVGAGLDDDLDVDVDVDSDADADTYANTLASLNADTPDPSPLALTQTPPSVSAEPPPRQSQPTPRDTQPTTPEQVLTFCVRQFVNLRLPQDEVNRETFDQLARINKKHREDEKARIRESEVERRRWRDFFQRGSGLSE